MERFVDTRQASSLSCRMPTSWNVSHFKPFVMHRQPSKSPDLNALDLGIFASIQSLQITKKLESIFLTFQVVMRLVLEHDGDNNFALPHLKKAALLRAGLLMSNVSCPISLIL
ncbi:hypothetical protein H257_17911 [Aphanomyces astaci]|uniref:Uncharacterized protein n=1 Tax=Aphanomyces astaci TaxID=112090 RepID=W4FCV8_APHAT|nr:hypothetical protein H257_17911 [Aphanomyces astaci]ETV65310.1 hypothetical protein H257_17911 [Aphanomyces astaci]|eukprot:XP_009845176.1 hypothetical protein H257_17911 [Aphanomyces astaci]